MTAGNVSPIVVNSGRARCQGCGITTARTSRTIEMPCMYGLRSAPRGTAISAIQVAARTNEAFWERARRSVGTAGSRLAQ